MRRSGDRWKGGLVAVGLGVLILLPGLGCGPAAMLIISAAGGAALLSGEPERASNTQGYDFDERSVARVRSEARTSQDVVNLLGNPQTKVFTNSGEEWAYRYYVPPSLFRSGFEKILSIRFREGKVQDVRYSISAL
jgi:outer membrane protein assembly factor BamE (lipoprotein component of BamABCDE complex)